MSTIVTENEAELVSQLGKLIVKASREAHKENGQFRVGVSGGSVVKFLTAALSHIETDFSHWKIFFCDERVVPVDDEDSTFGVYKRELVGKVNIKEEQFVQIKQGVSAEEAAEDYVQQLATHFPPDSLPRFDLLLLGIGPDGHTCSLFPEHRLLMENSKWVASITDSPKPPPSRITLTYPVINNAKMIIFALAGTGKADIVRKILVDNVELPATLVRPTKGQLYWILDKDAAKYL